jgi:uncharacterized peroxidase-related enzyme
MEEGVKATEHNGGTRTMPRIKPVDQNSADPVTVELLASVRKSKGAVPNLVATMAHSPAVAGAYLGFAQALSGGRLPRRLREQIALLVGEANACDYCVAAHTALGRRAGPSEEETREARRASSHDGKEQAAPGFARKVVQDRGLVADDDVERLRYAGYTDGEVGEIVANVALNLFTNDFNHVAATELDFPAAPDLAV